MIIFNKYKKAIFYVFIKIGTNIFCMEQKEKVKINHKEDFMPINLLVYENQDLSFVKELILDLKKQEYRQFYPGGLLLYGDFEIEKYKLAKTISKLTDLQILTIKAKNINKLTLKLKKGFNLPNKNEDPLILFIPKIDKIFLKRDCSIPRKKLLNQMLTNLIIFRNSYQGFIYFIFTSYIGPIDFPPTDRINDLIYNIIKINLPNYYQRLEIIKYYINTLLKDVINKDYNINLLIDNYSKILADKTKEFSCSDIEKFIILTRKAIIENTPNKEFYTSSESINSNSLDFKNKPINSIIVLAKSYLTNIQFLNYFNNNYQNLLYNFCEIQAKEVQNRENYKKNQNK